MDALLILYEKMYNKNLQGNFIMCADISKDKR